MPQTLEEAQPRKFQVMVVVKLEDRVPNTSQASVSKAEFTFVLTSVPLRVQMLVPCIPDVRQD